MTWRFKYGCQSLRPRPLEEEPQRGSVTPAVSEGGDKLRQSALLHSGGHLVGHHHSDVVAGRRGDELLGEAVEEACPM